MSGKIEQAPNLLDGENAAPADERLAEDELFDEADRRPCHCVGGTNYCI